MRFWSAVFTIETDRGRHWFKVANPGQGFEAALASVLASLVPDHVVAPVAVDVGRAWILTADQGPTLRDSGPATIEQWELVGRETARMQQALVPHAAEVIGAGVSTLAASDVPAYVMAAVHELEHLPSDHPQHVTAEVADRVLATIPQRQDDATLLDASGLPDTLQHNDLGDANAFVDGERVRLLDLGDSFWSHPLPVMEIPLAKAVGWPLPGLDDERVRRVLLAYLAEWRDEPESLLDLWPAARRLARVHRFASWTRVCAEVPPEFALEDDLRLIDYLDPTFP
ncbi:hypothetical protein JNB_14568 [Janibacter sp. HTCC2649]|nr:hypothetical protein JNB_14568 [Janibacter sp. HTCC2649]